MSVSQLAAQSYEASVKGAYRPGVATDLAGAWNIFTITGGPIIMTELWGHVTTIIANAAVPILTFVTTLGAVAAATATIMVTLNTDAPGTVYTWSGALAGVPGPAAALGMAAAGETTMAGNYCIFVPGTLYFTNAVAATGIIDWYMNYIPCVPGALVTPA